MKLKPFGGAGKAWTPSTLVLSLGDAARMACASSRCATAKVEKLATTIAAAATTAPFNCQYRFFTSILLFPKRETLLGLEKIPFRNGAFPQLTSGKDAPKKSLLRSYG